MLFIDGGVKPDIPCAETRALCEKSKFVDQAGVWDGKPSTEPLSNPLLVTGEGEFVVKKAFGDDS
jgi:hypothetical protein